MSIGTNIYSLRKEKKLTQSQLAEKLGVSEQAVSKWENGQCAPDVSLFPVIAELFGVSIDRIFGYHTSSYNEAVKQILKEADDSMDTRKEIEIYSEGLKKYPNSPELKVSLAFSLSMINRMSEDENERKEAVRRAISLCQEVVDSCGDIKQVDDALNMLTRIYNETGNYANAEECIAKISADRFNARITGTVSLLGNKKCYAEQKAYAEKALLKMYLTMNHVFEYITHTQSRCENKYEDALAFFDAHERLLSICDSGCAAFNATAKIFACENKAHTYMQMGDKSNCLKELRRFFELAEQVRAVAKSPDLTPSVRNPLYFSNLDEEFSHDHAEEYMAEIYPEKALGKYDGFFGDDEDWVRFKSEVGA